MCASVNRIHKRIHILINWINWIWPTLSMAKWNQIKKTNNSQYDNGNNQPVSQRTHKTRKSSLNLLHILFKMLSTLCACDFDSPSVRFLPFACYQIPLKTDKNGEVHWYCQKWGKTKIQHLDTHTHTHSQIFPHFLWRYQIWYSFSFFVAFWNACIYLHFYWVK